MADKPSDSCRARPRALLWSAGFWARHLGFVVALVAGACLLRAVWALSVGSVDSPLKRALSVFVVGLAIYAAREAAHTLAIIDVDRALAQYIVIHGRALLRDLRANPAKRHRLEELATFLPENPSNPAISRMFSHVLEEARDREFGSTATLLPIYREGVFARFNKIERLQQVALRLGILGTFVGLAEAMRVVPDGLRALMPAAASSGAPAAASALERQGSIVRTGESLLTFLSDAFGTSIVGLVVACGISGMAFVVRGQMSRYFELMEQSAEVSLSLARNALSESDFHEAFERLIHRLDELKRHLFDRVAKLGESVDRLQGKVGEQTETMADALVALNDGATSIGELMSRLSGRQDELAKQFETVVTKAGFSSLFGRIEAAVQKAGEGVGADMTRELKQISQQLEQLQVALRSAAAVASTPPALPRPTPALQPPATPWTVRRGPSSGVDLQSSSELGREVSFTPLASGAAALDKPKRLPTLWWGLAGTAVLLAAILGLALR